MCQITDFQNRFVNVVTTTFAGIFIHIILTRKLHFCEDKLIETVHKVMLLYLCNGNVYRIDTVELIDGCYPRITYDVVAFTGNDRNSDGVRSPPPTEEYSVSNLEIEPALWGIILILDRVTVDLTKRRFSWATASVGKILDDEGTDDPSYRTHYADDEHYEYDDNIDELFKLAEHLITISHTRTKSTRESHEEQACLIRMLYCCILPQIQIYQKDQEKVENAIKKQMSYISKIEEDIDRDSQLLTDLCEVLYKQQDERLQQFESIVLKKKCSKNFVTVLMDDLTKRKAKVWEQIDEHTNAVAQIKDDISKNGETEEKKVQLQEARKPRDHLQQRILDPILMATAGTFKEALESKGFQLHDKETAILEYLKSTEMIKKQKSVTEKHMEKKVKATSILENLKRIKDDITKDDGVASATMTSTSGVRPTDVMTGSHVPEYQTLSERVAAILNNSEHPLGDEFANFTIKIRECCKEIMEDAETAKSTEKQKSNSAKLENGYLVVDNDGTLQKEYLTPIENLCKEIKIHFERVSQLFLEQFNSRNDALKRKLQLCYEDNFYSEVGKDISKIYEMAYKQHRKKMVGDLISLSTYPINCLDLGMKDEWWLKLFEKRRQVSVARENRQRSLSAPIPHDSESLSSNSSSPSENDTSTGREHRKLSKRGTVHQAIIKFIRRKSKEVITQGSDENSNGILGNNLCYDNYHAETSCTVNKTSEVIVAPIRNGTRYSASSSGSSESASPLDENGWSVDDEREMPKNEELQQDLSMFAKYFGPCMDCLKDLFRESSVFGKLKCLTRSLTKVTEAVYELRQQVLEKVNDDTRFSMAITADDLLPLMVLIMLQMDPADAASIVVELKMMEDLIPRFLSSGCHGYALVEFDMASKVLQSLCTQFDLSNLLSTSA